MLRFKGMIMRMLMRWLKKIGIVLVALFSLCLMVVLVAFGILKIRTKGICTDFSSVYENQKYRSPVSVSGIDVVKQQISCGYAVIEMFAMWNGNSGITEQSLYAEYGKIVTSTGKAFEKEMNRRFPEYTTTMHKYLKNEELLDLVYESLAGGVPVPFEWSAKLGDEWTLHYSLITGLDVPGDKITIMNPYGYIEDITLQEFVDRTSFESYNDMPLFLELGFAFGIFEKNTVFIVE